MKKITLFTCLASVLVFNSCKQPTTAIEKDITLYPFVEVLHADTSTRKIGYIDREGHIVIQPQFLNVDLFVDGLALVEDQHQMKGFIDESGKYVIPPDYLYALGFTEGLALVVKPGQSCQFIDKKGEVKITLDSAEWVEPFSDGMASFSANNRCGYINKSGAIAIPAQFWTASPFTEGLAAVSMHTPGLPTKYGYINKEGDVAIGYEYDTALPFHDGMALVRKDGDYGFIDKQGKYVIAPQYSALDDRFVRDRCRAQQGGAWGYIDMRGRFVIRPQFKDCGRFSVNGLAYALPGGSDTNYGYINANGDMVIAPQFGFACPFFGKLAVAGENLYMVNLIDEKGNKKMQSPVCMHFVAFDPVTTRENCFSGYVPSDKPTAKYVATKWLEGLYGYDLDDIVKYTAADAQPFVAASRRVLDNIREKGDPGPGPEVAVISADVKGDTALVRYMISSDSRGSHMIHLRRDNGVWMVHIFKGDDLDFPDMSGPEQAMK